MHLSMYSDHKIHSRMNGTVDMKLTSGIEWPDRRCIAAIEGEINSWRARLCCRDLFGSLPGTIFENMLYSDIIDYRKRIAFGNGNGGLKEVRRSHVDSRSRCG